MDYKTAGVDVTAGRAFVERIKSCVEKTHKSEVIGGLGGFGGCISCLLYTSPSPRDPKTSRMPSSA